MELIDQKTKRIMEGCKDRARAAGLRFEDETLEYVVTNRDLLELSPKMMIPSLYDYWVHDVEVIKEKGRYELYPSNPYETVINTRPAVSFYNDNNPDWLNVMIFYHVLAHIDFFQNNLFFRHTWDYDFSGRALSDKRLIAALRSQHGRWVDYIIEFSRGLDNLVGYYRELSAVNRPAPARLSRLDFYFDVFLQAKNGYGSKSITEYLKEIDRYNQCLAENKALAERTFFGELIKRRPEFEAAYRKYLAEPPRRAVDPLQFLINESAFLNKGDNQWMKSVIEVVRNTSLFFQPQIRTKIMNEGWASYWHETLFLQDDRIKGREVDFSRVNAYVTALPRIGLNPYALGMRLFTYIFEQADKGRLSYDFERLADSARRRDYDAQTGDGERFIFQVRENLCDFTFISDFLDQDFIDKHKLFVSGKRLNRARQSWEYYVKSRKAEDYRRMLIDQLYHPPWVEVDQSKAADGVLYLVHRFEGKPLIKDFIANTLLGAEYLWDGPVDLETSEPTPSSAATLEKPPRAGEEPEVDWVRVVYTMKQRKLYRKVI